MRKARFSHRPPRARWFVGPTAFLLCVRLSIADIVINEIHYNSEPNTAADEFVELYNTSSGAVDISGWYFSDGIDFTFPPGSQIPAEGYVVVAERPMSILSEFGVTAFGPYQGELSGDGERVALKDASGTLVDEVTYQPSFPWPVGADGTGSSMELINPSLDNDLGGSWRSSGTGEVSLTPTPGAANSVFATNAPPQIRQVDVSPKQPAANQTATITAKVTDPDGVASVTLEYQPVAPGAYIPAYLAKSTSALLADPDSPRAMNPAYTNGWVPAAMLDNGTSGDMTAGDGIYTVVLPGRTNRMLVRFRITVQDTLGNKIRVPYADDPSLNFAYFVYNGVPDYTVTTSVLGGPHTYPASVITSIPVYELITTSNDFAQCVAFNSADQIPKDNYDAREAYNWSGTFVYDGDVYDNMGYRLHQRNARYSDPPGGKRSFKFRFNRGNYPQFRDMDGNDYPTHWETLSSHKMRGSRNNPYWGLDQAANNFLWNLMNVPASYTHWFNLRVIKQPEEAPSGANGQYLGDYYGMLLGFEDYDARFLDAHHLEKGNVYKLLSYQTNGISTRQYQAQDAVDDGSDFTNIIFNLRPERSDAWLLQYVNYNEWYRYHAIVDAVRDYDVQPNVGEHLKNRFYYFEPSTNTPLGRVWLMPWDSDTSWGPNFNGGEDFCKQAIYGYGGGSPRQSFVRDYLNTVREVRDLIWNQEQITLLLDPLAARIAAVVPADRDRWTGAPASAGTQADPPIEDVVADMKKFAFVGGSWIGGNDSLQTATSMDSGISGQQGRDAYLDVLAGNPWVPATPVVMATGPANFPVNHLTFETANYSGAYAFAARKWRIAEVTLTNELPLPPGEDPQFEITANWESGEITNENDRAITIPATAVRVGRTYRVRVRTEDIGGTWSHWSAPVQFVTAEPDTATAMLSDLKLTELMYHSPADSDFDFVELHNANPTEPLDISGAKFTQGVDYTFPAGIIIAPDGYLVVIKNSDPNAFRAYYHLSTNVPLAGPYSGNFANDGEQVTLRTSVGGTDIASFTYQDGRGWPLTADGSGHSLVPLVMDDQADGALNYGGNWRASTYINGSPGDADPPSPDCIVLNEVAAHTDYPLLPPDDSNDWIELYNRSTNDFVFEPNWYLSDDGAPANLKKWMIPAGTVIPAGGFVSFDEQTGFHHPTNTGFGLNKAGEQVLLSYLPGNAQDRVVDSLAFKGQENGWSIGRYPDGAPWWYALTPTSRGTTNTAPDLHVSISEIMYHPPDLPGGVDNSTNEFIEIYNPTVASVSLFNTNGTWHLDGGIQFNFPSNLVLAPHGHLVIVSFNPNNTTVANAFRLHYGVSPLQPLYGPYSGKLANSTDRVSLEKPQHPETTNDPVSWVIVDEVIYADRAPWEQGADGIGPSLQRINFLEHGCDPANWHAASPSLGGAYAGGDAPAITSQPSPDSQIIAVGSPVTYSVTADSALPLYYQWLLDNSPISDATNATFTLNSAAVDDSGKYRAVVLNAAGSEISSVAELIVKNLPVITRQPDSITVRPGTNVTFSVAATGTGLLTYTWYYDGNPVSGATTTNLNLSNVQATNEGAYYVTVADVNGTVVSETAQLTVLVDPFVVVPPAGQTVVAGDNVAFSIVTDGTLPMSYRWVRDGTTLKNDIVNAYINFLSITNVQTNQAGLYSVWLTNAASSSPGVQSPAAQLIVLADSDGDHMPDVWETQHGLNPNNPNDAVLDSDGDGMSNLEEYLAGTDPMDPDSYLRIENITSTLGLTANVSLTFQAVSNHTYSVLYSDELSPGLWDKLADVSSAATNRTVEITDQPSLLTEKRFYRLTTPQVDNP